MAAVRKQKPLPALQKKDKRRLSQEEVFLSSNGGGPNCGRWESGEEDGGHRRRSNGELAPLKQRRDSGEGSREGARRNSQELQPIKQRRRSSGEVAVPKSKRRASRDGSSRQDSLEVPDPRDDSMHKLQKTVTFHEDDDDKNIRNKSKKDSELVKSKRNRSYSDGSKSNTSPRDRVIQSYSNQPSLRKRKDSATHRRGSAEAEPYEEFRNLRIGSPAPRQHSDDISGSLNISGVGRRHLEPEGKPIMKVPSFPSITVHNVENARAEHNKDESQQSTSPRESKKGRVRGNVSHLHNSHKKIDINSMPLDGVSGGGLRSSSQSHQLLSPSSTNMDATTNHSRRYTFGDVGSTNPDALPDAIHSKGRRRSMETPRNDGALSPTVTPWSGRGVSPNRSPLPSPHASPRQERKPIPARLEPLGRERSRTTSK